MDSPPKTNPPDADLPATKKSRSATSIAFLLAFMIGTGAAAYYFWEFREVAHPSPTMAPATPAPVKLQYGLLSRDMKVTGANGVIMLPINTKVRILSISHGQVEIEHDQGISSIERGAINLQQ